MSTNNKNKDTRILGRRKLEIKKRLRRKQWEEQEQPMLRGSNIHYEMGERNGAINCGVANIGGPLVCSISRFNRLSENADSFNSPMREG